MSNLWNSAPFSPIQKCISKGKLVRMSLLDLAVARGETGGGMGKIGEGD